MRLSPRKSFWGLSALTTLLLAKSLWALIPLGGSSLAVAPQALSEPLIGMLAAGGDASFGQTATPGFTSYSAAGPGTAAYTDIQILGRPDIVAALGGSFEGWANGIRVRSDLVNAVKGLGTFPNVINSKRTPYVSLYFDLDSGMNAASGNAYQTFINIVRSNNWWLYETAGGTGTIVPSAASGTGYFNINYAYAYATAAGTVPLGFTIVGNAYGTQSNSQGPARTGAQYAGTLFLTTNRTTDTRFSSLPVGDAAPNADGLYLDNVMAYPNAGGNLVTQASWDGQNLQTNATIAAYPTGASSLLADGQAQFFATLNAYLATVNPGVTYQHTINFGSYANEISNGNTHTATAEAMTGVVNVGYLEDVGGVAGFGWQAFQTAADILANINSGLTFLSTGGRELVGVKLPATDGSSTSWFLTGGVGQTVATGTALEYQEMRCFMALSYMVTGNVYFAPATAGYDYGTLRWYDEAGDDSLTQVNVKRGWLGHPMGPAITLPNGVMARQFSGGAVLFNDWANGSITVTAAMLSTAFGGTYLRLNGTQQPTINNGSVFSSYTMLSGDGLMLQVI